MGDGVPFRIALTAAESALLLRHLPGLVGLRWPPDLDEPRDVPGTVRTLVGIKDRVRTMPPVLDLSEDERRCLCHFAYDLASNRLWRTPEYDTVIGLEGRLREEEP